MGRTTQAAKPSAPARSRFDTDFFKPKPSRKRNHALIESEENLVNVKRFRTVDCVLIPTLNSSDLKAPTSHATAEHKENRSPTNSDILSSTKKHVSPTPQSRSLHVAQVRSELSEAIDIVPPGRDASIGGADHVQRSKRTVPRVSYVSIQDDDSDKSEKDDLSSRKRRIKSARNDESSDYEQNDSFADDAEVDPDEFVDDIDGEESSVASVDEGELSDIEPSTRESRNRPVQPKSSSKQQQAPRKSTGKKGSERMSNLLKRSGMPKGLDASLPPLHAIDDIFADLTAKALGFGLGQVLEHMKSGELRVATMCSGTESPILALRMIQNFLDTQSKTSLKIKHLFSAEIVPYKQAYIERNFHPPIIFRDITELTEAVKQAKPTATTAYGAKIAIPTRIHLLIAGTSCVDFSRLNNHQKGLSDGGESDKTWHAVLNYCIAFRPTIVLLENVKNADWDKMLSDYESIGYEVSGVHVDTKDFYIPQTRQRGYMVCFDSRSMEEGSVKSASKRWESLMSSFRRPASSPASSFLMPNDQVIVREQSRIDDAKRDYDWSRCEITQMQYRQTQRLGNARPFTNWQESGAMSIPDHGSKTWYADQVERVLDTIDAATLRKALPKNGGYDCRYKTRIWNLSQNIYRDEDNQPFGTIGCVTPSGQYFISDAGRAMTPEETLKLQGLPLNLISFTTETPAELQDLAGNAMSSSVVGSAILAALIAGHKGIAQGDTASPKTALNEVSAMPLISGPLAAQKCTVEAGQLSIAELLSNARRAMRRCHCEHSTGLARKPIQKCVDCGHTSCTSCGGNPAHTYRQEQIITADRISPSKFEADLREKLPLRLKFEVPIDAISGCSTEVKLKPYFDAVHAAIKDDLSLSHVRRTHCFTVTYMSSCGRLEIVISDTHAEWQLFAKCPASLPTNDWLRLALTQPVAKAVLQTTILDVEWQIRIPESSKAVFNIAGSGREMPSWWSRNEMPDFTDHWQWEFLDVSMSDKNKSSRLEGRYRYLPKCGTACDSLYKKIDTDEDFFLFLDPVRVGDPIEDKFVFSTNKAMLEYDEVRPILASVDASWKPWSLSPWQKAEATRKQKGTKQPLLIKQNSKLGETTVSIDHQWRSVPSIALVPISQEIDIFLPKGGLSDLNNDTPDCIISRTLISCQFTNTTVVARNELRNIATEDEDFFACNSWIFEAMRRQLSCEWQQLIVKDCPSACDICAPKRPSLRWRLAPDGDIVAYEDPSSATAYERSIKNRSAPLIVQQDDATVRFGVNLMTLAHRARSKLPASAENVRFTWKLTTAAPNAQFVFSPFLLRTSEGLVPYSKDVLTVKMFPKQRLALAWMRQQEAGSGQPFTLEQSEEASVPKLQWTIEMRVQSQVHIRGGVCADHPGFGKTITSLALIESQFRDVDADQIVDELRAHSKITSHGLIPLAATLIVCPSVLLDQWIGEIEDKLGWTRGVLAIRTVNDLAKHDIHKFKSSKIILVNRSVLGTEQYAEKLAAFAGIPGPVANRSRSFKEWLAYASKQVPVHLRILQESGQGHLRQHVKQIYAERVKSDEFKAAVPSKRLRGKDYASSDKKKRGWDASGKSAVSALDASSVGNPLFEMFYFNRLIIDEFHQYSPREYAAIAALNADKRWGLSATPALGDFYDVAQMAGLLGVPLPLGSDARGIMKTKNIRELRKEMTDFERFDAMRGDSSHASHQRIHDLHQSFLDTFVRRNIMEFEGMEYVDHLKTIQLDIDHQALYTELSQHLNSLDMRIKKSTKSKNTSREERLTLILDESLSAEEALSKTALFDPEGVGALSQQDGLNKLVDIRSAEVSSIEAKFRQAAGGAKGKEPDALQAWIANRLDGGSMGDLDTINVLKRICSDAVATKPTSKGSKKKRNASSESDGEGYVGDSGGKFVLTSVVNTLAQRLLVARRSVRFAQNVRSIRESVAGEHGQQSLCGNPDCHSTKSDRTAVSALCGHLICEDCFQHMEERHTTRCPSQGCAASMHGYHLLWSHKMGNLKNNDHSKYGAKIDSTLDLIEHIRDLNDQAIVFVQYPRQLDHLNDALSKRGIPAIVVDEPSKAGAKIEEFRASAQKPKEKKTTVLVLNASDETAAGSNLQNANHVIFLSPLLRDTQYGYDSTMAQAIGRVRRHGQKKRINVYRIVALNTIDVDILEHRERRTDVLYDLDTPESHRALTPRTMHTNGPTRPERTQLVRENGRFTLRPMSWLVADVSDGASADVERVRRKHRVAGWEDFSSLVKFSRAYTEDDD